MSDPKEKKGQMTKSTDLIGKQVVVVRCEVEHYTPTISPSPPYTQIVIEDDEGVAHSITLDGLQGQEGKAIAVISGDCG